MRFKKLAVELGLELWSLIAKCLLVVITRGASCSVSPLCPFFGYFYGFALKTVGQIRAHH